MSKIARENLSFDKKSWSLETGIYLCLTIYHSLRATHMLQLLIDINLKPLARYHENLTKILRERTI